MTVSYSDTFGKLLLRWNGSLWKSIWQDLLGFIILYYAVNFIYRFALTPDQQLNFRQYIALFEVATGYIPLTFLLGFYVFMIVDRWWQQFNYIAWPDRFMMFVTTYLNGQTEELRMIRRTIARWCTLTAVFSWRNNAIRILKRFPTLDHIEKAGLATHEEIELFKNTNGPYGKFFIPCIWIVTLLKKCQVRGLIDVYELKQLVKEIQIYRIAFGMIACFDWISVPLVYTQVVTIATYGYFAICLIGRQEPGGKICYLPTPFNRTAEGMISADCTPSREPLDMFFPFFTVLQFFFYMGWLKVGEALMNPFGEDDDDFDMNYILDRNFQVAFMIADDAHGQLPHLEKDIFWNTPLPTLPHTVASIKHRDRVFKGHLLDYMISDDEAKQVKPGSEEEAQLAAEAEKDVRDKLRVTVNELREQARRPSRLLTKPFTHEEDENRNIKKRNDLEAANATELEPLEEEGQTEEDAGKPSIHVERMIE